MNYEQWLAALCLWREGRGLSLSALSGIWHVIQNRATDEQRRWPRTIAGVILQHAQFSSFLATDPNATKFPLPPTPPQGASADWAAFLDCMTVVSSELDADGTMGANAYESLPPESVKPAWAAPDKVTVQIGPIRFYRL